MNKNPLEFEMELALRGEIKTYFIVAYYDTEFEFDADLEPWIKSINVTEAIIIDRFDDSWQMKIAPDKDGYLDSFDKEIFNDIAEAIEKKEGERLINEWLIELEQSYLGDEFDRLYGGGCMQ